MQSASLWGRAHLRRGILDATLCDKVCQWLVAGFLLVLRLPPPINLTVWFITYYKWCTWCHVQKSFCLSNVHFMIDFHYIRLHQFFCCISDHCVHYYDLRNTKQAVMVFKGHRKAVSYCKFVNSREIVSA